MLSFFNGFRTEKGNNLEKKRRKSRDKVIAASARLLFSFKTRPFIIKFTLEDVINKNNDFKSYFSSKFWRKKEEKGTRSWRKRLEKEERRGSWKMFWVFKKRKKKEKRKFVENAVSHLKLANVNVNNRLCCRESLNFSPFFIF